MNSLNALNRSSRQKKEGGASGMGTVSIFCILLVCCLSAFAILALVSASADARLSDKNAALVRAYYYADSTAETLLADLVASWSAGEAPGEEQLRSLLQHDDVSAVRIERRQEGLLVAYAVAMDSEGVMQLSVEILLRPPGESRRFERLQWRMETDESGDVYDDSLLVWTPPQG